MKLGTVGKMNELQTRYATIVERLVPLLTSFLTFEDSLNDHTTKHKFIEKTRSLPSNIEKTWSTDRRRAPKFPILSLPILNITSTSEAKFGYVSFGQSSNSIAYMIPKLSVIFIANDYGCYVLTPGDQVNIYGAPCNALVIGYITDQEFTAFVFENVAYSF